MDIIINDEFHLPNVMQIRYLKINKKYIDETDMRKIIL